MAYSNDVKPIALFTQALNGAAVSVRHRSERMIHALSARSVRVFVLVAVAATMGFIDMAMTLHYMMTIGMCEANPLARFVAAGGPSVLVVFKTTTIAISAGLLILCRRKRSAEIGAWLTVAILAWVLFSWTGYVAAAQQTGPFASMCADSWVAM